MVSKQHSPTKAWALSKHPFLRRYQGPHTIINKLVASKNWGGMISNSDLELACGLMQLETLARTFDIRERTVLSKGNNLNTTFWGGKGSTTTNYAPTCLLRLFGIHQQYHCYVPWFDYLSGPKNHIADAASCDFHLSWP